jgi:GDSL/SGNH-like Acyl-Esterase family found in Pmr5 and Cas1p
MEYQLCQLTKTNDLFLKSVCKTLLMEKRSGKAMIKTSFQLAFVVLILFPRRSLSEVASSNEEDRSLPSFANSNTYGHSVHRKSYAGKELQAQLGLPLSPKSYLESSGNEAFDTLQSFSSLEYPVSAQGSFHEESKRIMHQPQLSSPNQSHERFLVQQPIQQGMKYQTDKIEDFQRLSSKDNDYRNPTTKLSSENVELGNALVANERSSPVRQYATSTTQGQNEDITLPLHPGTRNFEGIRGAGSQYSNSRENGLLRSQEKRFEDDRNTENQSNGIGESNPNTNNREDFSMTTPANSLNQPRVFISDSSRETGNQMLNQYNLRKQSQQDKTNSVDPVITSISGVTDYANGFQAAGVEISRGALRNKVAGTHPMLRNGENDNKIQRINEKGQEEDPSMSFSMDGQNRYVNKQGLDEESNRLQADSFDKEKTSLLHSRNHDFVTGYQAPEKQTSALRKESQRVDNAQLDVDDTSSLNTMQDAYPSSIPSHVQICSSILGEQGQAKEPYIERAEICLEEFSPSAALATIFLSSYLAQNAKFHGYAIDYHHNCGDLRIDQRVIQELLPSPIALPPNEVIMPNDHLQQICKMIEDTWNRDKISNALDILLWDTKFSIPQVFIDTERKEKRAVAKSQSIMSTAVLENLIPYVFQNMPKAAMKSRLVKSSLKAGYGVLEGRDENSYPIAVGRAVIYLPCKDLDCQDLILIPYTSFLLHLPLSAHTIDILVSPRCIKGLQGCARYVNDLASTIRLFSPLMFVELIPAEAANPDTIARLVEAEYTICGPGYGMVCLFPSLGRNQGRVTLFDVDSDQKEGETTSSFVARLSQRSVNHITPPTAPFVVAFLSDFRGQEMAMIAFVQLSPSSSNGECRFFRGREGYWVQDMDYAVYAQYRTSLNHYSGNTEKTFRKRMERGENRGHKFLPSTTYRFAENRYQPCATSLITQEGICDALQSLNAHRIFIVGDSLNFQLAQSLWMWLTTEKDGDSPTAQGSMDSNFKYNLGCPDGRTFVLQFVRNDELLENEDPVSIDQNIKNCENYCFPWTKAYKEDIRRTIMVFNVGTHMKDFDKYSAAIDRFVNVFDALKRNNDIVIFRTLLPGHLDCSRPGLAPYPSFNEYKADVENYQGGINEWNKFSEFNDYAIRKLDYRRFDPTPQALMEVLDVVPMTILRPDGHCSDEFRPSSYLDSDCTHYNLPGPLDWWSHLMFNHIRDIAAAEKELLRMT